MQYHTKQKRLVAIADAYMEVSGRSSFTQREAINWGLGQGLFPVPKHRDPEAVCQVWEDRLNEAKTNIESEADA